MRRSRFSEEQIIRVLERVQCGEAVKDVCRKSATHTTAELPSRLSVWAHRRRHAAVGLSCGAVNVAPIGIVRARSGMQWSIVSRRREDPHQFRFRQWFVAERRERIE